jgi:hypothetical protein
MDSAARWTRMEAMEQSSIQTSELFSSPHTTKARVASFKNEAPWDFALDSLSSRSDRVTTIKHQGLIDREEGERNAASTNAWIFFSSMGLFWYFLMLRLFCSKDRNITGILIP